MNNPDLSGNIRDYATLEQLTVLANLESMNAELIREDVPINKRARRLSKIARTQMKTLLNNQKSLDTIRRLNRNNNNLLE